MDDNDDADFDQTFGWWQNSWGSDLIPYQTPPISTMVFHRRFAYIWKHFGELVQAQALIGVCPM